MSLWRVNDLEFELDLMDADQAERYQLAFESLAQTEAELPKDGNLANIIRANCNLYYKLFDDIFGDNTGNKIFAGKKNIQTCEKVFDNFFDFCQKEVSGMQKERAKRYEKYTPKRR